MTYLEKFKARAVKLSDHFYDQIAEERMKLAVEVRTKVLLPFCKKHKLTMSIGIYSNDFKLPNGDIHSDYDLHKVISDPMAKEIEKYLSIDYMGDHLFDYHLCLDITKEDLKA